MLLQNITKLLQKYGMNFLNGLGTTLLLALISVAIGCVIGALVAIMRLSKSKVLRGIATVYTEVIRDTPLLLQLYFFYFLLPDILPALKLSKFTCIAVALVINSGAYMSEVFRSGIQSIDRGQTEAARSLGMTGWQTMRRVVLPQAFKNILPALGNEFVTVIKESSIVMTIGITELMFNTSQVYSSSFRYFESLIVCALVYFVMTFTTSRLLGVMERRMKRSA